MHPRHAKSPGDLAAPDPNAIVKSSIYTQLVLICGHQNYSLSTRHVIDGVVDEDSCEGEVTCLIPNRRVARKFCAKSVTTCAT